MAPREWEAGTSSSTASQTQPESNQTSVVVSASTASEQAQPGGFDGIDLQIQTSDSTDERRQAEISERPVSHTQTSGIADSIGEQRQDVISERVVPGTVTSDSTGAKRQAETYERVVSDTRSCDSTDEPTQSETPTDSTDEQTQTENPSASPNEQRQVALNFQISASADEQTHVEDNQTLHVPTRAAAENYRQMEVDSSDRIRLHHGLLNTRSRNMEGNAGDVQAGALGRRVRRYRIVTEVIHLQLFHYVHVPPHIHQLENAARFPNGGGLAIQVQSRCPDCGGVWCRHCGGHFGPPVGQSAHGTRYPPFVPSQNFGPSSPPNHAHAQRQFQENPDHVHHFRPQGLIDLNALPIFPPQNFHDFHFGRSYFPSQSFSIVPYFPENNNNVPYFPPHNFGASNTQTYTSPQNRNDFSS